MTQSAYSLRTTIACPEPKVPDGNQLALLTGESSEDDKTFGVATMQDASRNLYAVASTPVTDTYTNTVNSPLDTLPNIFGADLEAAGRAQAVLVIGTPSAPPTAAPDKITAILDVSKSSALDHLAAMGLTRVPQDEPV